MSNRLRLLSGPHYPWTPHVLSRSVLRAWWCADDWTVPLLSTDDGSGVMSSWKDRFNLLDATAATTARPTAAADSFVGSDATTHAGVTGDGTANAMTATTNVSTFIPNGANAGEIWVLASYPTLTINHLVSTGTSSTTANARGIRRASAAFRHNVFAETAGTMTIFSALANEIGGTGGNGITGPFIIGEIVSGTTVDLRINGRGSGQTPVAIVPNTTATRLRLFASSAVAASLFCAATIRHVLFTTALSAQQRLQLEGWLAWDGGCMALLPPTHPYRWTRP